MQPEDLVGQTLGHYRIKRQIGYGGMATVFLGEDIHLNREVALKVFWPRPGETQDFLRRFAREARVLAQLDHPNILPVYDYGEQGELAFLVTPYMSGGTLKDVLRERKALPPSEAIQLISQVLPALQYAHDRNLIHRDIKPANLLFKGDGSVVLADFGLVKVVEGENREDTLLHTLSEAGQSIAGTPEYMAPEQIEGKAVAASDIYSLGIVLYEMVTGVRPFTGDSLLSVLMKHVNEAPRPPRELNPYISQPLEAAILKAIEKDPKQRFARPADFQQALKHITHPSSNPGMAGLAQTASTPDEYATQTQSTQEELGAAITANRPEIRGRTGAALQPQGADMRRQSTPGQPVPNRPANPSPWPPEPGALPAQAQAGRGPVTPLPPVQTWNVSQTVPPSFTPMPRPKRSRTPLAVLVILLALLAGLVASLFLTPIGAALFGPHTSTTPTPHAGTPGPGGTPTLARGGSTPTPGNTQTMPATSTACPVSGQARAGVFAPLVLGQDPTIVYLVNESDKSGNPTFGTVKIYNTTTGAKKELAKTNTTSVTEAQVSNDGEWVLFAATVSGQSELRLVRLDGQGLQTLLCAPSGMTIRGSQWSIDQKQVIFDEFPQSGSPTVYLLNIQTGALQVEVTPPTSGLSLLPRTWLDNQHVLMTGIVPNSGAPQQNIYVLNISNGANQSIASARQVFTSTQPCWDFDSSYDSRTLFIAQCTLAQPHGSSTIVRQSSNGGTTTPVLSSSTLAFNTVRVVNKQSTNLLALASDTGLGESTGDPANDGLYLVQTNGSAPLRLTITHSGQSSQLNAYSQYFWANVSRNVSQYALETITPGNNIYELSYGQLNGGTPTVFASISDGTVMSIAGWTTT